MAKPPKSRGATAAKGSEKRKPARAKTPGKTRTAASKAADGAKPAKPRGAASGTKVKAASAATKPTAKKALASKPAKPAAATKSKAAKPATAPKPASATKPAAATKAKASTAPRQSTATKPAPAASTPTAPRTTAATPNKAKAATAKRSGAKAPKGSKAKTPKTPRAAKRPPAPRYLAAELGQPVDREGEPIGAGSAAVRSDKTLQDYTLQLWRQMQSGGVVNRYMRAIERAGLTIDEVWTAGITETRSTSSTADEMRRYREKLLFRANLLEAILSETVADLHRLDGIEPSPGPTESPAATASETV